MCVDRCVRVSVCSMMCSLCTFCIIFFNEEEKSFLKKGEAGLLFLMYMYLGRYILVFLVYGTSPLGYPKFTIKSVL